VERSTPNPGFSGTGGLITRITFQAKTSGIADMSYNQTAWSNISLKPDDTDILNLSKSTGARFTINPSDTTPPTTSIISPVLGSKVSDTIIVSAVAGDDTNVAGVELYVDGSLVATDTVSPYEFTWDTTQSSNAVHTLQTKAYDAAGNIGSSSIINVTVDNTTKDITPPTTSIISPLNNTTVTRKSTVSITASATDNVGVSKVEFYVNAVLQCTDTSSPYLCSWKVPGVKGKIYKLYAKVFDTSNNVVSSPIVNVTAK